MDAIAADLANRYSNYTFDKIAHLKRAGLVSATKTGRGQNGGACPDWLADVQKDEHKRLEAYANREARRAFGADDGL